jgi:hypothetical protein
VPPLVSPRTTVPDPVVEAGEHGLKVHKVPDPTIRRAVTRLECGGEHVHARCHTAMAHAGKVGVPSEDSQWRGRERGCSTRTGPER